MIEMISKKEVAVLKYMELRIRGLGVGLSKGEVGILNSIPSKEWNGIREAIVELGGTLPR